MENEEFLKILQKFNNGTASNHEKQLVNAYYKAFEVRPEVLNMLSSDEREGLKDKIKSNLHQQIASVQSKVVKRPAALHYKMLAAAIVFIILAVSAGFYIALENGYVYPAHYYAKHNLPPGANKAVLTLANGQQIALGRGGNRLLAMQGNASIIRLSSGQIAYNRSSALNGGSGTVYNTITTPRGGQYQVMLADGSKVFLNSGSSLRFPAEFNGNERKVNLTGEAYFEVAHDKTKPFRVAVGSQTVEVLGTHFNINAYADEQLYKTTLLEGSVKVFNADGSAIIKPGEQAQTAGGAGPIQVEEHADTEQVVAWKNGLFQFNNADLPAIMRVLSRWYDVDVEYEGAIPERRFSGKIYRDISIAQAFEIINFSGIRFRMEKQPGSQKTTKITVIP